MTEERKPIGYLMGKPIYESPDPLLQISQELVFCQITPEIAERCMCHLVADRLAGMLVAEAPKVGI